MLSTLGEQRCSCTHNRAGEAAPIPQMEEGCQGQPPVVFSMAAIDPGNYCLFPPGTLGVPPAAGGGGVCVWDTCQQMHKKTTSGAVRCLLRVCLKRFWAHGCWSPDLPFHFELPWKSLSYLNQALISRR